MNRQTLHIAALVLTGAFLAPRLSAADSPNDILVVVNNSVPVENIPADRVRNFFLKKAQRFKGGMKVFPVNAREGTDIRKEFRKRLLDMTANEETRYWQDQKIKGGITPPPELGNTQKAVFKIKGAVSYVFRSEYKEKTSKVVLVLPAS
ncbi:MAG: hypothetical protein GY854_18315 [Deltaproteobacteria bacterium]|nr:hypothetical protein [Deltaproteobacteria bacterium]